MVALPAELEDMLPTQLTFGDLRGPFAEVGIDSRHIKQMEIDCSRDSKQGLVLVVTYYDLNTEGQRYVSSITKDAAIAIARFPLTFLEFEAE